MGCMAQDSPLGFFPRSSRSPSCQCLIPCGKPHSDFPWFSHLCVATFAPSFPGLDVGHIGFPSFSFSSGQATTSSALILLVRRLTLQLEAVQIEVHNMARAATSPPPSRPAQPSPSPRASTPVGAHPQSCSAGHLLAPSHSALRLHLPLPSGFALVVAVLLLYSRFALRDIVTLIVIVTGGRNRVGSSHFCSKHGVVYFAP